MLVLRWFGERLEDDGAEAVISLVVGVAVGSSTAGVVLPLSSLLLLSYPDMIAIPLLPKGKRAASSSTVALLSLLLVEAAVVSKFMFVGDVRFPVVQKGKQEKEFVVQFCQWVHNKRIRTNCSKRPLEIYRRRRWCYCGVLKLHDARRKFCSGG